MKRFKGSKKVFIFIGIGVLVLLGIAMTVLKPGVEVSGVFVEKGIVERFVEEKGVVKAMRSQNVYAKNGGEVIELKKLPGDKVLKGDVLAYLSTADSELQLLTLSSQKTALEKSLEALKKPASSESLSIAWGDVTVAKAALDAAKKDYDNGLLLLNSGALSQDALNQLKLNYDQGGVLYLQAKERYNLIVKGNSTEVVAEVQAQVDALNYELQLMESNQESFALMAPMDGIVVDKMIEKGEYLAPAALAYEVADLSQLFIQVELLVSDASDIQVGAEVVVSLEETDGVVQGRVDRIYPKAFSKVSDLGVEQKRIKMDIQLLQDVKLLYGSEVTVKVYKEKKEGVLIIPDSAIFDGEKSSEVFLLVGDTIKLQPVIIGIEGNKAIEILEGLVEGQVVLDSPDTKRSPGEKVKVNIE